MRRDPENIIVVPILTEKSNEGRTLQKYTFKVSVRANKIEIMRAIHKLYNVTPVSCNTVKVKGKKKKQGKYVGKTSAYKKAILTLKKGDTISIFEGV